MLLGGPQGGETQGCENQVLGPCASHQGFIPVQNDLANLWEARDGGTWVASANGISQNREEMSRERECGTRKWEA